MERHLSQNALARICGISQSHISKIELGDSPSLEVFERICNALHMHPLELMSIEET